LNKFMENAKYKIEFAPGVDKIYKKLDGSLRKRADQQISRISEEPYLFADPLRYGLYGFWKAKGGKVRVIFKILEPPNMVIVITDIDVRKQVYCGH